MYDILYLISPFASIIGLILFAVFVQSVTSRSGQANMLGEILIVEIDISKYFTLLNIASLTLFTRNLCTIALSNFTSV